MISVIIPTLGREPQLRRAVASALRQELPVGEALEIVVVDDGSSPPIPRSGWADGVSVLRLDRNRGPAGARNAGVEASRGELIAFLDSDDVWLPGKLAAQVALWRQLAAGRPAGMTAVGCGFYYPDRISGRLEARRPLGAEDIAVFAAGCWFAPGSTVLIAHSDYERVGPFDERLRRLEDYDWYLRFGAMGGQLAVADVMGALIPPANHMPYDTVQVAADAIEARAASDSPPLSVTARRRMHAYLQLERAVAAAASGQRLAAAMHLARSFARVPRLRLQVARLSTRSGDIPQEVAGLWLEMKRLG